MPVAGAVDSEVCVMPGCHWTDDEKRIHAIVYPHFPDVLVARGLGKSIAAVRSRGYDHNMRKTARGKSNGYKYGWRVKRCKQ